MASDLCKAIARFSTQCIRPSEQDDRNPARVANRASLTKTLAAATAGCSRVDLISALSQAGVPAGPIDTVAETIGDPQIVARGLQIAPEGIPGLRTPFRFSRSPLVLDRADPALGAAESTLKTR